MSIRRISLLNDWVGINAPFSHTWGAAARKMGGELRTVGRRNVYAFPSSLLSSVDEALIRCFGVPSLDENAPRIPSVRFRLRATIMGQREPAHLYGYVLARGGGRDAEQVPGPGVFLISGDLGVGGSNNNWTCYAEQGARFQIEAFPAAYLQALADDERVELIDADASAEFERAAQAAIAALRQAGFAANEPLLRAAIVCKSS